MEKLNTSDCAYVRLYSCECINMCACMGMFGGQINATHLSQLLSILLLRQGLLLNESSLVGSMDPLGPAFPALSIHGHSWFGGELRIQTHVS